MVSEGSYPVTRGGLSEWAHLLMKTLNDVRFDVFCVTVPEKAKVVYSKPDNVDTMRVMPLVSTLPRSKNRLPRRISGLVAESLRNTLTGTPMNLEVLVQAYRRYSLNKSYLLSRSHWESIVDFYQHTQPDEQFVTYYWTIFGLYSVLLDIIALTGQIPAADVYHCLSTGYAGLVGALGKIVHGSPVLLTEQGLYLVERQRELARMPDVSEWYRELLMRFTESMVKTSYKYSDCVVPPSQKHTEVEKGLGLAPEKIRVIANGIDCDYFSPGVTKKNGNAPVVGCFARVVPIKGIEVLIKAAKGVLQKQDADFVVVGEIQDPAYHRECKRLVAQLGLSEHFKFIGHSNPLEWYRKVDIFTLSSISEGVPYALLEAMSCGLPSVCTAVGGVPEIIGNYGVGYIVPPNQPEALEEKLGVLIADKKLRAEMGQRAIKEAYSKYHIRDMAARFLAEYRRLAYG